jgi:EthD domain
MTPRNPGPWVDPERVEDAPWRTQDGIVKFFEFPARIAEMSSRAFHLHWQKHHSPHAMHVTAFSQFMRKYNSTHRYPGDPVALSPRYAPMPRAEGAAEVWINRVSEIEDWLGHPLYPELIQPDEPRFIAQDGSAEIMIAKEERLFKADPDLAENLKTKVYLLAQRPAGRDHDAFHAAASAHARAILDDPSLARHLIQFVLSHRLRDPLPMGMEGGAIDVIFEFWFDDIASANAFFAEPAFGEGMAEREAALSGDAPLHALAAKVRVVHDEFSFQPSTTQPLPFAW